MKKYIQRKIRQFIYILVIVSIFSLGVKKENVLSFTETSSASTIAQKTMESQIIEENQSNLYKLGTYNPIYSFQGELTGYVGNCRAAGCTGYLACPMYNDGRTRKRSMYVGDGTLWYNDATYGKVRVVASSRDYPCGTIVRFNVPKLSSEPIIAIIGDRGVGGNVLDLLVESETYAIRTVGRVRNLQIDVLRQGWDK